MSQSFDPDAAAAADSGIFGLPHGREDAAVVLVPVPFDATTSYRAGASKGPAAILEASHQVDLWDVGSEATEAPGFLVYPTVALIGISIYIGIDANFTAGTALKAAESLLKIGGVQ